MNKQVVSLVLMVLFLFNVAMIIISATSHDKLTVSSRHISVESRGGRSQHPLSGINRDSLLDVGVVIVNKDNLYQIEMMEYAYFEGQKDALEGKVKIKKTKTWDWAPGASPWDNGRAVKYNPK